MLAGSISVKFVGLFVVLLVGIHTAFELWLLLQDCNNSVSTGTLKLFAYSNQRLLQIFQVVKHFLARALCLIGIPVVLYIVFFYVHLKVLNHS